MKKSRSVLCLLLALVGCFSLVACGGLNPAGGAEKAVSAAPAAEPAETHPDVYASSFTELIQDSPDYIVPRSYGEDGLYYSSWEKVGENIPEGKTPEFDGQYDVYGTFLYFVDREGKITRLENYRTVEPPANEDGRQEFGSGSDLAGICFTPEGFVTVESTYASWYEGDGSIELYSDEYFQNQRYEQKYYIRSFDRSGRELSCAPIDVPENGWLDAYRMQLDSRGNAVVCSEIGRAHV